MDRDDMVEALVEDAMFGDRDALRRFVKKHFSSLSDEDVKQAFSDAGLGGGDNATA